MMPTKTFIILIFCALLAGCMPGGMAFSPQEAAVRSVTSGGDPTMTLDQGSVQVRQSVAVDRKVFVVISYSQHDATRQDKCLSVHEAERNNFGAWVLHSGGSGCTGTMIGEAEPPPMPVEAGGGTGGGFGPNDPSYSYTYGLVNTTEKGETISKVRVTWNDEQAQEVPVVNGSYIAARAGELRFTKLEGLDSSANVVYTFDTLAGPGLP